MFTIEFEDFAPILKPISVVIYIPVYIQRQLDTVDSVKRLCLQYYLTFLLTYLIFCMTVQWD